MDSLGYNSALLVSDPLHMKRASNFSKKLNINTLPSPTKTTMYRSNTTKFKSLFYETFYYTLWKGLYAQLDVMPTWQVFVNNNGNKIDNGFQIFNSYRFGYHIKLFKDKFFFQPSICMTHRAYHTQLPDVFKELDDKWSKFVFPEPGLNIGYNF